MRAPTFGLATMPQPPIKSALEMWIAQWQMDILYDHLTKTGELEKMPSPDGMPVTRQS
jgi:hypothetical protein